MNLFLFLPLALGVSVVAQATLNRQFALQYGLASAVAVNAAVFFVLSLGFFLLAKYTPALVPEFLQVRSSSQNFRWIYFLPGAFGFALVLGMPWALQNIGPSRSFLLLIASQIICSLGSEIWQAGQMPSMIRAVGALFILLGAYLIV